MEGIYTCGYDGSPASRNAVRFTAGLAAAVGTRVVAVTVREVAGNRFGGRQPRQDGRALLSELAGLGVPGAVRQADSPARGLHEAAVELAAALLAIGAPASGGAARERSGSVAHQLLHGAPCAVAVVPADAAGAVRTLAVAHDARAGTRTALDFAQRLARPLQARLVVLWAPDRRAREALPAPALPWGGGRAERADERDAVEQLRRAVRGREAPGGTELRVLEGAPGDALVSACTSGIDLLVAGSRGYGPLRSVLLGSVSRFLADHAPCPVVLVPREAASVPDHAAPDSYAHPSA